MTTDLVTYLSFDGDCDFAFMLREPRNRKFGTFELSPT